MDPYFTRPSHFPPKASTNPLSNEKKTRHIPYLGHPPAAQASTTDPHRRFCRPAPDAKRSHRANFRAGHPTAHYRFRQGVKGRALWNVQVLLARVGLVACRGRSTPSLTLRSRESVSPSPVGGLETLLTFRMGCLWLIVDFIGGVWAFALLLPTGRSRGSARGSLSFFSK